MLPFCTSRRPPKVASEKGGSGKKNMFRLLKRNF